jgi:hypothetical protein
MSGVRYFQYADDAAAREKELEIVNSLGKPTRLPRPDLTFITFCYRPSFPSSSPY